MISGIFKDMLISLSSHISYEVTPFYEPEPYWGQTREEKAFFEWEKLSVIQLFLLFQSDVAVVVLHNP